MGMQIEKFQQHGGKLKTDDIDFSTFVASPLSGDVLRCLEYMHDIEYHTVCYARELLVTRLWRDPNATAFLTLWNYEEYWHGEAIGRVLEAHGRVAHTPRLAKMREDNKRYLSMSPLIYWGLSKATRHFDAVQMTWGAINEWTANAGYGRLAQLADHPTLTELLTRIQRQEGRHAGYYSSWANDLLADSRRARSVTRWFLRRLWAPVGNGDVPKAETSFVTSYLFGGPDAAPVVDRIEERIDALPGLSGLTLLRTAVVAAQAEVATPSSRRVRRGSWKGDLLGAA